MNIGRDMAALLRKRTVLWGVTLAVGASVLGDDLEVQKLVGYAVMPCSVLWMALGFLTVRLLRTTAVESRRLGAIAGGVFAAYTILGNAWFSGLLMTFLEGRAAAYSIASSPSFDAVFVLGGSTWTWRDGSIELSENGDRAVLAARLYHSGRARILVASGSGFAPGVEAGKLPDLSSETEKLWIELGVPAEAIRRLPGPRNTSEEVAAYKVILAKEGWRNVGVISSAWHLPRVLRLCRAQGIKVEPVAGDHRAGGPPWHLAYVIPQAAAWKTVQLFFWEAVGMLAGR